MVAFTVELATARRACAESILGFVEAAASVGEYDLLAASRCHGWTRLDVVVHLITGWQEMLGPMTFGVDDEPTVDAASYWPAFAAAYGSGDPVSTLMSQRRRTAAYARPASALDQLREVSEALARGVESFDDRHRRWQGHVFTAGDYLTVWAVENAVHHLDLDLGGEAAGPVPTSAMSAARATIEALVQEPLPPRWSDRDAVLIGTGRSGLPSDTARLMHRLPALG